MLNTKSMLVGAVIGWLSMIAGLQVAKADCSQDMSYEQAAAEAAECDTNYGEVVAVPGGFEAYCVPDHSAEACIEVSSLLDCSGMSAEACDETMGQMFEACVVLYHSSK